MHVLNDALNELRNVIPYTHFVKKLSKIATLFLAYGLEEMKLVLYLLHTAWLLIPCLPATPLVPLPLVVLFFDGDLGYGDRLRHFVVVVIIV